MITRLGVKNFKSLYRFESATSPLNVLVGPNRAGKSNVVDVFLFLQQLLFPEPGTEGLSFALAKRSGIGEVRWKGADDSLIEISLEGTSRSADSRFEYVLQIIGGQGGYAQIQRETLRVLVGDRMKDLISDEGGTRWLVNRDGKQVSGYPGTSRSALQNADTRWEGSELTQTIGNWRFYHFVPQVMKEANPAGSGGVLTPHGQNLSSWLMGLQTRFPTCFNRIVEAARDTFPGLLNLITWPTAQGTVYLASHEIGLKRPTTVWQMSDGELAFLALLSLIYTPPELAAPLYCIEEPENHLHPHLISTLFDLLRQVRSEHKPTELSQLFITTQSPAVVDQASLEEIIWMEKKDGASIASRPQDRSHLKKLIEDRDLGLGDIVFSGLLQETK